MTLLLVSFLAACAAKMVTIKFAAHQPEPAVTKGAEFHRALDLDWNADSSASSAQNSLQKILPVELRQHSTRPSMI
jgi:hypothetical protein